MEIARWQLLLLVLILVVAAFLRLYRIRDYLVFLGDQGRDVLVVKRIIVDRKFTLLGPTASVGGFYLGPFYYYLMIVPLWLSAFDPSGPAIMVALFGVATVFLIYFIVNKVFDSQSALVSAFLYSVSPLVVRNSRFSWNPNILPFFSLLYFYFLYLAILKKYRWLYFLAGIILGICFQLHYLALILAPLGVILIFEKKIKNWFLNCLYIFFGTIISFWPFLLFELRHGFGNLKAILEFMTRKGGAIGFYPTGLPFAFLEISERIFANFFGLEKGLLIQLIVYSTLVFLVYKLFRKTISQRSRFILLLLVWWLGGGLSLRLYQGTIYDYYYGWLYPIPAIALGLLLTFLIKKNFLLKVFSFFLFILFLYSCLKKQPIFGMPNRMVEQTERIAYSIIDYSAGQPFNFALISSGNSDHAYRYFLEIDNHKPVPLEERVEEQLFVVCEETVCQPLGHPLWEIAAFGRAEIVGEWMDKVGIKIFKLVHHQDSIDWIGKPAPKGI